MDNLARAYYTGTHFHVYLLLCNKYIIKYIAVLLWNVDVISHIRSISKSLFTQCSLCMQVLASWSWEVIQYTVSTVQCSAVQYSAVQCKAGAIALLHMNLAIASKWYLNRRGVNRYTQCVIHVGLFHGNCLSFNLQLAQLCLKSNHHISCRFLYHIIPTSV